MSIQLELNDSALKTISENLSEFLQLILMEQLKFLHRSGHQFSLYIASLNEVCLF